MMGEVGPLPLIQLAVAPYTSYPVMVRPSVLVGGVKETMAVCGHGVATAFVAVVVAPEPDVLVEPELLELLELELEPELELLELDEPDFEPELLEELLEPELLLELEPPELLLEDELDFEPELLEVLEPELEPLELEELDLEPELLEELLEPELPELEAPELDELEPPELEPPELEPVAPELDAPPLEEDVTSLGDVLLLPLVTSELEEPTTEPDVPVLSVLVPVVLEVVDVGIGVVLSSQALRPASRKHTPRGANVDLMLFRVIIGSCKKRHTQNEPQRSWASFIRTVSNTDNASPIGDFFENLRDPCHAFVITFEQRARLARARRRAARCA